MKTKADGAFRALSDPTRRQILTLLAQQEMTIAEVVSEFVVTRAAVKKHLIILEQGNLITVHVRGRERINRINAQGLKPVLDWLNELDSFWDDRLHQLKEAVEGEPGANNV